MNVSMSPDQVNVPSHGMIEICDGPDRVYLHFLASSEEAAVSRLVQFAADLIEQATAMQRKIRG